MADLTYLPPLSADSRRRLLQLQQDTPLNSTARIAVTENNEPTLKANARMVTITTLAAYTRTVNTLEANANGAMGTIDGVAPAVGDRFLLKNGAAGADNGLYTVTTLGGASSKWGAIRSEDADATYKVTPGLSVFISEGTTQADTFWTITTNAPITLNTTSITFSETSAAGFALYATLALTTNANGASLIGVEDAIATFTAANVEAALAEVRTKLSTVAAPATLTIATGAITVTASHHAVDTEAAAASDDLNTISGLQDGQFVVLRSVSAARNVVLTSGVGNIFCPSNASITLDGTSDRVLLMRSGADVFVLAFNTAANGGGGLGLALGSSAANLGASLVGIEDSGALLTASNVEAATAELAAYAIGTAGSSGTVGAIHNARYLKGTYSFAVQGGAQGDIAIASVQVPMGAMVTRLIYAVTTTFTSGGAATIAFKIQNAADLIADANLATNGSIGAHGAAPLVTPIILSAARTLTMTVSTANLTAGVANFYLEYVN